MTKIELKREHGRPESTLRKLERARESSRELESCRERERDDPKIMREICCKSD